MKYRHYLYSVHLSFIKALPKISLPNKIGAFELFYFDK